MTMADMLLGAAAGTVYLVMVGALAERDARIAQMEIATARCLPRQERDVATLTLRQGRLECAIVNRHRLVRRVAYQD